MKQYMLLCMLVLLVSISGCTSSGDRLSLDRERIVKEMHTALEEQPVENTLPEIVQAVVRDIIDGDTIDVDLDAVNMETDEELSLPEYGSTGHARIRLSGINAPEKSPKGEILCTDLEIYKVEKAFADKAREALLPLNDKTVILMIDPANPFDTHGRILAMVEYQGENICLLQLMRGLACGYYREENRYVDRELYTAETLKARESGIGMWAVPPTTEEFVLYIDSIPSNARLYIDGRYTNHLTPSDESELSDVMHMLSPGEHVFRAEKSGMAGEVKAVITEGNNPDIIILLEDNNVCVQEWSCTEWGECMNGTQKRVCRDEHACGSKSNMPEESRNCSVPEVNTTENETEKSTVIISEIMYDPVQDDNYNEWIEIHNQLNNSINLTGWTLCGKELLPGYINHSNGEIEGDNGLILGPDSYAVITDGGTGTQVYENFEVNTSSLALHIDAGSICNKLTNTGNRTIVINDSKENIIDSIYYEGTNKNEGISIVRSGNEMVQGTENGTPGY